MSAAWLIAIFVIVFVAIAIVIVKLKINPAIALLLGTIVLGVATGVSLTDIVDGLNSGFGGLMAEVGLLISLGVMMGFLMSSYGAVQRIVEAIVGLFRKKGSPYAFGLTLSTITPSIYFDVLLVLVAPIARSVAVRTNRPVASIAGPVAMGLAAGNALVIPGSALLAYIGMLHLSPAEMLLPGFAFAIPAMIVTTYLYILLMERLRWWNQSLDEEGDLSELIEDRSGATSETGTLRNPAVLPSLFTALLPIVVTLVLIISGIVLPLMGVDADVIGFLGSPVIALLTGTITALVITAIKKGFAAQDEEIDKALQTVGTILVVTAVAGSLGTIIAGTGIQEVLAGLFQASSALPLLLVWVVAAVLRMAVGGQTVSGITAIGIIAPAIADLGLSPVLVVVAAAAGGIFGGQFSDNAFWMMRSLFGLSTRGALKTYTLGQSMLSIVVLAMVLAADVFV